MPKGKGIYDDENHDEPASGRRTDSDGAKDAGAQDEAPDVAETGSEPTA